MKQLLRTMAVVNLGLEGNILHYTILTNNSFKCISPKTVNRLVLRMEGGHFIELTTAEKPKYQKGDLAESVRMSFELNENEKAMLDNDKLIEVSLYHQHGVEFHSLVR